MKKNAVKRLVYVGTGEQYIGGIEYDAHLTNDNILGSIHELGKTAWVNGNLWLLREGMPAFRIEVHTFYHYTKRWYERLIDTVRRI